MVKRTKLKANETAVSVKRRKGRDTAAPLVFDHSDRLEYVSGFQKRKKERRSKAKQEEKENEKKEQRKARLAYKERIYEQHKQLRESIAKEADLCRDGGLEDLVAAHQLILNPRKAGIASAPGSLKKVTRMKSNFYGGSDVVLDIDFGIPNEFKDPLDTRRPPRPEEDEGKPGDVTFPSYFLFTVSCKHHINRFTSFVLFSSSDINCNLFFQRLRGENRMLPRKYVGSVSWALKRLFQRERRPGDLCQNDVPHFRLIVAPVLLIFSNCTKISKTGFGQNIEDVK
eukprot:GHVN01073176.1.p1 GENE.GHVN01073176.1~~GHVN01073176.1.p1  ORF type:complete len:284 (+),score=42.08 GHVN01073176.1:47-898(+)